MVDGVQRHGTAPLAEPVAELDEAAAQPPEVGVARRQPVQAELVDAVAVRAEAQVVGECRVEQPAPV